MSRSDVFALKNAGLDPFLCAEVGTELNGSNLTILSVLARLGCDPWAEAASWCALPRATTIDRLAQSIAQMPLCPQALLDARATAARLILLLPSQAHVPEPDARVQTRVGATLARFRPTLKTALLFFVLAMAALTVANLLTSQSSRQDGAAPGGVSDFKP